MNKPHSSAPQLIAAVYCERAIEDKRTNMATVVNILDKITLQANQPGESKQASSGLSLAFGLCLFLALRSGNAHGEHELTLDFEGPSYPKKTIHRERLVFPEEPQNGFNMILDYQFRISMGGIFYTHVNIDEKTLTMMPLLIDIQQSEFA